MVDGSRSVVRPSVERPRDRRRRRDSAPQDPGIRRQSPRGRGRLRASRGWLARPRARTGDGHWMGSAARRRVARVRSRRRARGRAMVVRHQRHVAANSRCAPHMVAPLSRLRSGAAGGGRCRRIRAALADGARRSARLVATSARSRRGSIGAAWRCRVRRARDGGARRARTAAAGGRATPAPRGIRASARAVADGAVSRAVPALCRGTRARSDLASDLPRPLHDRFDCGHAAYRPAVSGRLGGHQCDLASGARGMHRR